MNPNGQTKKWNAIPTNARDSLLWHYENLYIPVRLARGSESTLYQYKLNLARFDTFLRRAALLSDLTDETITRLGRWSESKHGLSPATAQKLESNMIALWNFLFRRRLIGKPREMSQPGGRLGDRPE